MKPQRIASLLASATEILYGLGLGEKVVAVSHECDFPPEVAIHCRVALTWLTNGHGSRQSLLASSLPMFVTRHQPTTARVGSGSGQKLPSENPSASMPKA